MHIKGVPLSSFDVFGEGVLLKQLDPESPERFTPALYHQLDLMIGTAFHSILFAVQAAIPVIAINYAPKVRQFMTDNGLTRYLLASDEYHRLSDLVDELLAKRPEVVTALRVIREKLHQDAQQNIQTIRQQIEESAPRHRRTGPKVTIAVLGSGSAEKDRLTHASCAAQSYENVEVVFVGADTQESLATRLQHTLAQFSGMYLTWVDGGDWFAEDTVDCLVSRMEQTHECDVLYTDYWSISEHNTLVGIHHVPEINKLYRRDVVGPCFLARKKVIDSVHNYPVGSPLPSYSLWLETSSKHRFDTFHTPLMYSRRQPHSQQVAKCERAARQIWRRNLPGWLRALWRIIDSDFGERYMVQPIVRLSQLLRNVIHAGR